MAMNLKNGFNETIYIECGTILITYYLLLLRIVFLGGGGWGVGALGREFFSCRVYGSSTWNGKVHVISWLKVISFYQCFVSTIQIPLIRIWIQKFLSPEPGCAKFRKFRSDMALDQGFLQQKFEKMSSCCARYATVPYVCSMAKCPHPSLFTYVSPSCLLCGRGGWNATRAGGPCGALPPFAYLEPAAAPRLTHSTSAVWRQAG